MDRPNIVLFMPDEMRADTAGCFGQLLDVTPWTSDLRGFVD